VDVDPSSEFGILVGVELGAHRVLLGAEVDGYDEEASEDDYVGPRGGRSYVELKTYT
jgi:hypothetical protein